MQLWIVTHESLCQILRLLVTQSTEAVLVKITEGIHVEQVQKILMRFFGE